MADPALAKFEITQAGDGYAIHVEDAAGGTIAVTATAEQLDVISDRLIEFLEEDDTDDGSGD